MLDLAIMQSADLLRKQTTAANGSQTTSLKRMGRKEFAEANRLDTKSKDFNQKYLDYIKGYDSLPVMLVEAFRQNGLTFAGTTVRENKHGVISSGAIRFGTVPLSKEQQKTLAAQQAAAQRARIAELEAKVKELEEKTALPQE